MELETRQTGSTAISKFSFYYLILGSIFHCQILLHELLQQPGLATGANERLH